MMTSPRRGPLLQALRDATSVQHRDVETLLPASWSTLGRDGYAAYLGRMAGFHLPVEARLFEAHDWAALGLHDATERRRAPLLRAELAALGVDPAALPYAFDVPDVADVARALGVLYVLEGSTLGGQVLAREVTRGATGVPTAFLGGAGDATGARWTSFCRFAEALAAGDPRVMARAPVAAGEAFAALAAWLRRPDAAAAY